MTNHQIILSEFQFLATLSRTLICISQACFGVKTTQSNNEQPDSLTTCNPEIIICITDSVNV